MAADDRDGSRPIEDVPAVDLTPLDPTGDEARFDDLVARVIRDARLELARRRGAPGRLGALATTWGRLAWPAAAAVALASLAVLRTSEPVLAAVDEPTVEEEMALAVGVPEALAPWVGETASPGLAQILLGWEPGE